MKKTNFKERYRNEIIISILTFIFLIGMSIIFILNTKYYYEAELAKNDEPVTYHICSKCSSDMVYESQYHNPNCDDIIDDINITPKTYYCLKCNSLTTLIEYKDYDNKSRTKEEIDSINLEYEKYLLLHNIKY